jgi:hypothetical protein
VYIGKGKLVNKVFSKLGYQTATKQARTVEFCEKGAVASLGKVVRENVRLAEVGVQGSEEQEDDDEDEKEEEGNLMDDIEKKRKLEAVEEQHGYANPNFIVGSAPEVERLRSLAGLIMTEKRYSTTPVNFAAICFLKFNRKWWDMSTIARAVRAAEQSGSTNERLEQAGEEEN